MAEVVDTPQQADGAVQADAVEPLQGHRAGEGAENAFKRITILQPKDLDDLLTVMMDGSRQGIRYTQGSARIVRNVLSGFFDRELEERRRPAVGVPMVVGVHRHRIGVHVVRDTRLRG